MSGLLENLIASNSFIFHTILETLSKQAHENSQKFPLSKAVLGKLQKAQNIFGNTIIGTDGVTNTDEFSEQFQTAFDPHPPHFRKIRLQIYYKGYIFILKKPCLKSKICNISFGIENATRPRPPTSLWNVSENSSVLVTPCPY